MPSAVESGENVEALFTEACSQHASGLELARAESLYRAVLARQPRHAAALHQLGALLVQRYGKDKSDEAHRLVTAAIQMAPACAKFRNSLGLVLQAAGRWREAADAFERANEKDPLNVAVMMNLARALRECGRQQRAAEVYGAVTKLHPDHPSAHYRRGAILRSLRRNEEALAAFRQHLRLHPDHTASRFWVAAITGDAEAMAAAPPDMVAGLFDQYADHFDDHLVNKLQYRTPEALLDQLLATCGGGNDGDASASDNGDTRSCSGAAAGTSTSESRSAPRIKSRSGPGPGSGSAAAPRRWRRCVDLGCGTGLMGPLLAPHCTAVEGVDLSAGMVAQAAQRGCYTRLEVAELVAFLTQEAAAAAAAAPAVAPAAPAAAAEAGAVAAYDLLVAADVFVYIGNLAPVLAAAAAAAAPGAVLAFSTEALERAPSGKVIRGPTVAAQFQQAEEQAAVAGGGGGAGEAGAGLGEGGKSREAAATAAAAGSGSCPGLRLQVTGRYAHTLEYLRSTGRECGWELVSSAQSVIRYNGGEPIWGHLCVMRQAGEGRVEQGRV